MPQTGTLDQWDRMLLKDIGAKYTPQNVNFLNTWVTREGGMQTKGYNPLFTTQREPGSWTVNSVGVQAFPTMAEGAQANAQVLMGGGYNDILNALRGGNPQINNPAYSDELMRWSGNSYGGFGGLGATAGSAQFGAPVRPVSSLDAGAALNEKLSAPQVAQAKQDFMFTQQAEQQLQQWIQEQSHQANLEAGYQRAGILLSEADLQAQQKALTREQGLAKYEQGLTEQQYGLQEKNYTQQFADMLRNYQTNTLQQRASQAAQGDWFTRGGRTDRTNLQKDYLSSKATLERQKAGFELGRKGEEANYREQVKQMQDQQQALHRMAQRYGISMQEVESRLKAQLSNIQYGGITSL